MEENTSTGGLLNEFPVCGDFHIQSKLLTVAGGQQS